MSITSVENIQDLLAAAKETNPSSKDKDRDPDAKDEKGPINFDDILRGRLTQNMVFTSIDAQTAVPERAVTELSASPIVERRDPRAEPEANRDDFGALSDIDSGSEQVVVKDHHRGEDPNTAGPIQDNSGDEAQAVASAAERGQNKSRGDDAAARKSSDKSSGNEAVKDGARTNVASTAANRAGPEIELADLPGANAKKNTQANVKVTKEAADIASQPQATLASRAALEAETAKVSRNRENTLNTLNSDADIELQENGQNVFTRAKANAAAQAANNAKRDAGGPKTQAEGNNQAQNAQQAQNAANQSQNVAFQNALNANGRAAATSNNGQVQQTVSVDAATGGTSVHGQNNALQQQRSTPSQSQQSAARTPTQQSPLTDQVAVNIQRGIAQGQDRINVQLRPQELGRVEIKMEINHDGRMTAVVAAERPETLDMLRQDSRSLIEALNQAGLKADENSLSFNLQGENAGDGQSLADLATGGGQQANDDEPQELPSLFDEFGSAGGGYTADGRLDFRV